MQTFKMQTFKSTREGPLSGLRSQPKGSHQIQFKQEGFSFFTGYCVHMSKTLIHDKLSHTDGYIIRIFPLVICHALTKGRQDFGNPPPPPLTLNTQNKAQLTLMSKFSLNFRSRLHYNVFFYNSWTLTEFSS